MSILSALLSEGMLPAELAAPQREVWLAIRNDTPAGAGVDDIFGSGTEDDPFNANTAQRFDRLMKEMALVGTIVRLGSGVFRTQGFGANLQSPIWEVRAM